MKNLSLIALLLFFSVQMLSAQALQKGNILLGTTTEISNPLTPTNNSVGFAILNNKTQRDGDKSDGSNTTVLSLSPAAGLFIIDRLLLGAELGFTYEKNENADDPATLFNIGPFARYYFNAGNVKPFIQANASAGRISFDSDSSTKINIFDLGLSAGASFFFNDYVSIDLILGYRYERISVQGGNSDFTELNNDFGLSFGFSFFID